MSTLAVYTNTYIMLISKRHISLAPINLSTNIEITPIKWNAPVSPFFKSIHTQALIIIHSWIPSISRASIVSVIIPLTDQLCLFAATGRRGNRKTWRLTTSSSGVCVERLSLQFTSVCSSSSTSVSTCLQGILKEVLDWTTSPFVASLLRVVISGVLRVAATLSHSHCLMFSCFLVKSRELSQAFALQCVDSPFRFGKQSPHYTSLHQDWYY